MNPSAAALSRAVQTNCHIADARHATDLTLCTYLLQMREFYRWEHALPFGAPLPREAVGTWIAERERQWAELEDHDFVALPLPDSAVQQRGEHEAPESLEPFDVDVLSPHIAPLGLAYGAGLAGRERPGFFLADLLLQLRLDDGVTLRVCGREHARGLFAPPAALVGDTIWLRRESLARWLWQLYETYSLREADGAFKAVVQAHDLDAGFDTALPGLLDEIGDMLVLHELGEHRAGRWLGPAWAEMRLALPSRRTDLAVRAVRDLLADFEVTLPTLLERNGTTALHFWFATFDGLREHLSPDLSAAYHAWRDGDGGSALRHACQRGTGHFRALADQLLHLHAEHGVQAGSAIDERLSQPAAVFRC
jgi:hypothetical protein